MIKSLRFPSMKSWMPYLFLISFYVVESQTQSFDINWGNSVRLNTAGGAIELPAFNPENYNFSDTNGLTFSAEWNTSGQLDESSAELKSIESVEVSKADLKQLPLSTIPNTPRLKISNAVYRNGSKGYVEINADYRS